MIKQTHAYRAALVLLADALARQNPTEVMTAIREGHPIRDLVDLMETMDQAAATRADLAALPGPLPRPPRPGGTAAPSEAPSRDRDRPPPYRLPVLGGVVAGMGELSENGVRSRGLTLTTRPGAQVVAPTGGRVVFAGPFKRYGAIVIIDHGKGWTSLVTGLASVSVSVGDRLVQGSPIGRTGSGADVRVTVELRRAGQPVDITALLG